jgi:hypothetical protein
LEWGWSHYFSNSGKLETMGYTLVEAENGFFSDTAKSHKQFLQKIKLFRRDKSGNYDGLLAKVSNFDWTFNPDGSYDITLTLISLGDVIESLKTNVSPRLLEGEENTLEKPKDVISELLYGWKQANVKNEGAGGTIQLRSIYAQLLGVSPAGHFIKPLTSSTQTFPSEEFSIPVNLLSDFNKNIEEYKKYIIDEVILYRKNLGVVVVDFIKILEDNGINKEKLTIIEDRFFWEEYSITYTIPAGNIELENDKNVIYFNYKIEEEGEKQYSDKLEKNKAAKYLIDNYKSWFKNSNKQATI